MTSTLTLFAETEWGSPAPLGSSLWYSLPNTCNTGDRQSELPGCRRFGRGRMPRMTGSASHSYGPPFAAWRICDRGSGIPQVAAPSTELEIESHTDAHVFLPASFCQQ